VALRVEVNQLAGLTLIALFTSEPALGGAVIRAAVKVAKQTGRQKVLEAMLTELYQAAEKADPNSSDALKHNFFHWLLEARVEKTDAFESTGERVIG